MTDTATQPRRRRAGRFGESYKVGEYLRRQAPKAFTIGDICAALDVTNAEVSRAVHSLTRQGWQIDRPARGVYRFVAEQPPESSQEPASPVQCGLFEHLGHLKDGRLLLQDEAGTLYAASVVRLG